MQHPIPRFDGEGVPALSLLFENGELKFYDEGENQSTRVYVNFEVSSVVADIQQTRTMVKVKADHSSLPGPPILTW